MSVASKITTRKSLLVLAVALFILAAAFALRTTRKPPEPSPESLFESVVISPIPESVRDINVSCPLDERRHGQITRVRVLRFDIGREDLSKVIASGGFVEWTVNYRDFYLDYRANGIGLTVPLYATDGEVPDWFDLRQWKGFTAYYAGDSRPIDMYIKAHLLLYNEQLGRAYFVDYDVIVKEPKLPVF